jgi:hypothetical protein
MIGWPFGRGLTADMDVAISTLMWQSQLNDGGIAKILSFSYSRSISDTPVIQQEICRYAGMIFEKEVDQLVRSNELRAPMQVLQY